MAELHIKSRICEFTIATSLKILWRVQSVGLLPHVPHKEYHHDILHTTAVGRLLLIIELIVVVYEHCDINTHVQYQRKIIMFNHSVYHTTTF